MLGIKPEDIEKELTAKWVKEDSFVPIKKIAKVKELEFTRTGSWRTIVEEQNDRKIIKNIWCNDFGCRSQRIPIKG